ncbi:MAG: hypothetical protein R2708_27520 [Vicinamibacterales bacterium]
MSHALRLALVAVSLASTAVLAQAPVAIDTLGPQPGSTAPEFSAVDQNGTTRTLASIAGPRGTMLVFSRSADW